MSKNILHLMGMSSTKYGGIEHFNVELSTHLYSKGFHSVFVYEDFPCVQQYVTDLQNTGAEIYAINSRKSVLQFCWKIWKLYKKYNFCTIHAHFTKARFYALPLAILYGIKNRIYTIHSSIERIDQLKLHTRLWYYWMNKKCRVITVSKKIEEIAKINWPNAVIDVIYLGIKPQVVDREIARSELNVDKRTIVITSIANFNRIKGLDVLCHAVKVLVNKKISDVKIYIVGQPIYEMNELEILIKQLQIEPYVVMEGIKNNIFTYLCASDIYVQPSRCEGIGLALMEASSVGLPIVASNVGGIPEVAQENRNALLIPSEDALNLAIALEKMICDSKLRNEYGKQSMNVYKETFCLKQNVSNLIEYYNL